MLRESARFVFRVNEFTVGVDIKNATTAYYKAGLCISLFFQIIRQTDGIRLIVSHTTVMNLELHRLPPRPVTLII